jgi:hypothetical protein
MKYSLVSPNPNLNPFQKNIITKTSLVLTSSICYNKGIEQYYISLDKDARIYRPSCSALTRKIIHILIFVNANFFALALMLVIPIYKNRFCEKKRGC